jgi:N-acetylated-alpha-linked acidic dipeptidase
MLLRSTVLLTSSVLLCSAQQAIRGFPPASLPQEKKWEDKARSIPEAARVGGYMKRMSSKPHLAGTPASKQNAEYALGLLKEWGLDAHLEEFEALLPTPKSRLLEVLSPQPFHAKLNEPPVPGDISSFNKDEVPTYNAYSGSGDVTAALVYVNYGMPGDYEYLAKNNIDVKGKIVIARYGGGWRGLKPRLAAEHGASGCLIYSDPKDDGYYRGDVYAKGAWRPADGVQRGSVMDMTLYPGDPLSPGWASEKGSKRLALSDAKTLMHIPVLPISYGDALPLLRQLTGPVAPDDWRGALGITYHIGNVAGSGAEKVRLKVEMNNSTHPIFDVIARIPGNDLPNEWVLAGNHHDAWVHGAMDPLSGASALLETARTLGQLYQQGWRPRRTILIALWDAEEFGLVGSTEYVEKHAAELSQKLVVYINSDSNGKGQFGAGGSHTLESFVSELTHDINDPVSGKPLADTMRIHAPSLNPAAQNTAEKKPAAPDWHLDALGSGSDYTSFLQHLGIASLNFGFMDESGSGGIYHSAYDTYNWYTHFSDTNFAYGKTLSTVTAISLLRMGDAAIVPFQFSLFADTVSRYLDEIEGLEKTDKKVDLSGVKAEVAKLQKSAGAFETAYGHALPKLQNATADKLAAVDENVFTSERKMLLDAGLPRRDWFKHAIYAPGSLTGYGVKTLPGIREAVEAGQIDEAQKQAALVAATLRRLNRQVEDAGKLLEGL